MSIEIFAAPDLPDDIELVAVGYFGQHPGPEILVAGRSIPELPTGRSIPELLVAAGFEGKVGQTHSAHNATVEGRPMVAVGLGRAENATLDTFRRAAAAAVRAVGKQTSLALMLGNGPVNNLSAADCSQAIAEGALLAAYRFTEHKSKSEPATLQRVVVVDGDAAGLERGAQIASAASLARDLVNHPANVMTPRRLAEVATEVAARSGLEVEVWDEHDIEREGLGCLRGVSLGSDEPPRLIRLTYEPALGGTTIPVTTVALVGKGITFDSGGLSLKLPDAMTTMKTDMSGAAAVISTMSVLRALEVPVKVVGIICATENLPGPKAVKPGDVLRARNGTTVEVVNTDAEGRLVLADGLSLAMELQPAPAAIVDVATLTGACIVALGREIGGLMGNNDELRNAVAAAGERAGEPLWPLPLPDSYRKHNDSDIADIKNLGDAKGAAGALSAGLFLEEFVGEVPWVHLDIAGPARADGDDGYITKGGTGFAVRTLVEWLQTYEP